jgi:hypothetical protein
MERCASKDTSMVGRPSAASELLVRAVWLAVIFAIAHLLGLRQWTSALLQGSKCGILERVGCSAYLFFYAAVVLIAPTLAIAAGLLVAWEAVLRLPRSCGRCRPRDTVGSADLLSTSGEEV